MTKVTRMRRLNFQRHHIEFQIRVSEIETDKTHIVLLSQDAINELLLLREQLSFAINEIEAVVGKSDQIQQNIDVHEKQANEINQSKKFSDPTL